MFSLSKAEHYLVYYQFQFICIEFRKRLLTGTLPVNDSLLTGTVPVNTFLLTGTVSDNYFLLTGTVPFKYFLLTGTGYSSIYPLWVSFVMSFP